MSEPIVDDESSGINECLESIVHNSDLGSILHNNNGLGTESLHTKARAHDQDTVCLKGE